MRQHAKNGQRFYSVGFPRDYHVHFAEPRFDKVFERVSFLAQFRLDHAHNKVLLLDNDHAIDVGEQLLMEDIGARQLLESPLLYQVDAALHYK